MSNTSRGVDRAPPPVAAMSVPEAADGTSKGTAESVLPLVPGSEEIIEETRLADVAAIDAGISP